MRHSLHLIHNGLQLTIICLREYVIENPWMQTVSKAVCNTDIYQVSLFWKAYHWLDRCVNKIYRIKQYNAKWTKDPTEIYQVGKEGDWVGKEGDCFWTFCNFVLFLELIAFFLEKKCLKFFWTMEPPWNFKINLKINYAESWIIRWIIIQSFRFLFMDRIFDHFIPLVINFLQLITCCSKHWLCWKLVIISHYLGKRSVEV